MTAWLGTVYIAGWCRRVVLISLLVRRQVRLLVSVGDIDGRWCEDQNPATTAHTTAFYSDVRDARSDP